MMRSLFKIYFILCFLELNGQIFYSPINLGTAGGNLTGHLGTHVLNTNPALLGLKSGEQQSMTPIDTFSILYRVRLIESDDKNELKDIESKLRRDGIDRSYEIVKKDSRFCLDAPGFEDSFSAANFTRNLPSSLSNYQILVDSIPEIYYRQRYEYKIQLYATNKKDSLKTFIKKSKPFIKGLKRSVTLNDSMYRFAVGNFNYEQEALIVKDSIVGRGLSPDAFVVKNEMKSSSMIAPKISLTFPGNYSFSLKNNLFDASWLNTYLGADMVEQPDLKVSLLESIPNEGVDGKIEFNSSFFDLTYKNFGLSLFNTTFYSNFNFPKSIFNLVFDGVKFDEPIDISDLDFRSYFLNSSSFSYGMPIDHESLPFETYIGLGIRAFAGNFAYLDSFEGSLMTSTDSVFIHYDQRLVLPDLNSFGPGHGFGLDFGIFFNVDERISGQISFIGLGSTLKSSAEVQHLKKEIRLSNDDFDKFDLSDESYTILDSLSYEDISISLPAKLNLGIDYILSDKIYLKSSIQHQMQTKFIGSVNPRFSIGAELFPKTKTPIWTGVSYGGIENSVSAGFGFGIHLGAFHFNYGINQVGGLFNKAKGLNLGFETRLVFF